MSNELELERHRGLRVGFRVQRAGASGESDPEGELLKIHRQSPTKRFGYSVDWHNGEPIEELSPASIVRSNFGDFPHWEDAAAQKPVWVPGTLHYWTRFYRDRPDTGSCLYCGRMRSVLASSDRAECSGPVAVELR